MTAKSSFRISSNCRNDGSVVLSPRTQLARCIVLGLGSLAIPAAFAQEQPIAYVPTEGVSLSGRLAVADGKASIGNNGSITAGDQTAQITLARGGDLRVCASTKVHLSRDNSSVAATDPTADSALMIALDRGAVETDYPTGKYSDVLLTPDLRVLISGPGHASLKIRVNRQGDTCVDNHGINAPYVTVTSQFEGGVYRVLPDQRVLFEHGSLQQVVDNEPEPCGCPAPPPVSVASTVTTITTNPAQPGQRLSQPVGGPSSTPADTAFPLAESEGLKPPPPPPSQPAVPAGVADAQVEAPIAYNSAATPNPTAPGAAGPPPASCTSTASPGCPNLSIVKRYIPTETIRLQAEIAPVQLQHPKKHGGFFHALGSFFGHLFGR
jgi:hypothetical protein